MGSLASLHAYGRKQAYFDLLFLPMLVRLEICLVRKDETKLIYGTRVKLFLEIGCTYEHDQYTDV